MSRTLLDEIVQARSAQADGQIGRARACARRAVGMAIGQTMGIGPGVQNYAPSYVEAARRLALDKSFPLEVRAAAMRLVSRSKKDRTSASDHPAQDAEIILKHFKITID